MAFMTATVFDQRSGRHELHFVNQQYDLLMYIAWSDERQDYLLDDGRTSETQAIAIARGAGNDHFVLSEHLAAARLELPERDRRRQAED